MITLRSVAVRRIGATLALVVAVSAVGIATTQSANAAPKSWTYTGKGNKTFTIHKPDGNAPYLVSVSFPKKTKGSFYLLSEDASGNTITQLTTQLAPWKGTVLMDPPGNVGFGKKLQMVTQSSLKAEKWKVVVKHASAAPVLHQGKKVTGHQGAVYYYTGPATNVTVSWKGSSKSSTLEVPYFMNYIAPNVSRNGFISYGVKSGTSETAAIPAGPIWIQIDGSQQSSGTWTLLAS